MPRFAPVARSSWQCMKLRVATWSFTTRPAGSQLWMRRWYSRRAPLLLGETRRRDAEASQAALGGVELGARARDRDPHRGMRLLHRLWQHRALGHREAVALPGEALLGPHARNRAHVLVPVLLRAVRVRFEAAELGPGRRAGRPELEAPTRDQVEGRRALGDADGVVHLAHTDDGAVANPDLLRLHGAGRQKDLGRARVRIAFEKMVLDGPDRVEAELVGEPHLLEGVLEDLRLVLRGEGTRRRQFVEDAELQDVACSRVVAPRRTIAAPQRATRSSGEHSIRFDYGCRSQGCRSGACPIRVCRARMALKLYAISDLHVGFKENRAALLALPAHPADWLILCGDLGDTPQQLDFALEVLSAKFAQLIWVPGNHELWTLPRATGSRGVARYAELVELCRRRRLPHARGPVPGLAGRGRAASAGARSSCSTTTAFAPTRSPWRTPSPGPSSRM